MKRGMSPLRSLWGRLALENRMKEAKVMAAWEELAGVAIAQQTRPTGIKGGVLWVAASSPAWVHQLTLMRFEIIGKIQTRFGRDLVTDIRFHSGAFQPLAQPERKARQQSQERLALAGLSEDEQRQLWERVAVIEDPELRERTYDLLKKTWMRQKALMKKGYKRCPTCATLQPQAGCTRCPLLRG